jgi:hypothetical protein
MAKGMNATSARGALPGFHRLERLPLHRCFGGLVGGEDPLGQSRQQQKLGNALHEDRP